MGSKNALSNGNETEELTELVEAFQRHNGVRIVISMSVEMHRGKLQLGVKGEAIQPDAGNVEPAPLVCTSATLWGGDYRHLMALLTRLLYVLDFQLAENEFRDAK